MNEREIRVLDRILDQKNISRAIQKVMLKNGGPGVDGMSAEDVLFDFAENYSAVCRKIRHRQYPPALLKEIHLPKDDGGERVIGVPTVTDRVLHQAAAQILGPIFSTDFSPFSFAYRSGLGGHDAIRCCLAHANQGFPYVAHLDIEDCFNSIDRKLLLGLLEKKVPEPTLLALMKQFWETGYLYRREVRL